MKRRQFLVSGLAMAAVPVAARAAPGGIAFGNAEWRVSLDPQTLMISVKPAGQASVTVSRGVARHAVAELKADASGASWTWDGQYRIVAALIDRDLHLSITATSAADLDLIDQPAEVFGRGMMYPKAEGHYVPAGDATWRDHLIDEDGINTTQDLSLPLWGLDHGAFTLNWLLTNPFNNRLLFGAEGEGLGLKVRHSFTSLSPTTPMTLILHLGTSDLTAGARRYRQYLIETGAYETLESKIAQSPEGAKLIGASHVYLWGNGLLGERDVRDWALFLKTLNGPSPLAVRLRGAFEADQLELLKAPPKPNAYLQGALITAVNGALETLARKVWQVDEDDADKLVATYTALRAEVIKTFGVALMPDPAQWGRGLSLRTAKTLQDAGLKRLWVGLADGWEGGLWHGEAVAAFVKAGYLIAPYDGYETVLPPGLRPDWYSVQHGKQVYDNCGIIRKDGTPKPGFMQMGHTTNAICITPHIHTRVTAVARAGGFNSWFMDAYATGEIYDDYHVGHEMTMTQHAEANAAASRWISQSLKMPTGSEGGNAVTARGIFFGHGMQTPVIGWGDPDLFKNKASPYYLGNWYPSEQPSNFFMPVPVKESYRIRHFAPQMRLPLYQSVFHGSVITTHHWGTDSLKLSNVRVENELAQLLYNVPPLYNLSVGSLAARLPVMVKQDTFFRPLHEALALRTMEGFAWLTDDRLVQQTTFSDGSRLIANFDAAARTVQDLNLPPHSVTALLTGQVSKVYTV